VTPRWAGRPRLQRPNDLEYFSAGGQHGSEGLKPLLEPRRPPWRGSCGVQRLPVGKCRGPPADLMALKQAGPPGATSSETDSGIYRQSSVGFLRAARNLAPHENCCSSQMHAMIEGHDLGHPVAFELAVVILRMSRDTVLRRLHHVAMARASRCRFSTHRSMTFPRSFLVASTWNHKSVLRPSFEPDPEPVIGRAFARPVGDPPR